MDACNLHFGNKIGCSSKQYGGVINHINFNLQLTI